ncbi:MAG: M23 family metallopeptidase [Corallococcus sp.]|nr:M23 family metallopeptidase [Corallococcus sp.]
MNSAKQSNKFTKFLRNHAALLLLIFCVAAIATVVLVVTLTSGNSPDVPDSPVVVDPGSDEPVNKDPENPVVKDKVKVYFASPVDYQTVGMEYTHGEDAMFVYNSTLQYWTTHNGADLIAAEGTAVNSMYDGTVVDVSETYGMGNIVKIDHGDNVIATYASLGDVQVVKGQKVAKGEQIGVVSTSASYEFIDGAHLHLEVAENGKNVDPMKYVNGEIFRETDAD